MPDLPLLQRLREEAARSINCGCRETDAMCDAHSLDFVEAHEYRMLARAALRAIGAEEG